MKDEESHPGKVRKRREGQQMERLKTQVSLASHHHLQHAGQPSYGSLLAHTSVQTGELGRGEMTSEPIADENFVFTIFDDKPLPCPSRGFVPSE